MSCSRSSSAAPGGDGSSQRLSPSVTRTTVPCSMVVDGPAARLEPRPHRHSSVMSSSFMRGILLQARPRGA
jgi:hypothetical protein